MTASYLRPIRLGLRGYRGLDIHTSIGLLVCVAHCVRIYNSTE